MTEVDYNQYTVTGSDYSDPKAREHSNRIIWLSREIKQPKPEIGVQQQYRILPAPVHGLGKKVSLHYKVGVSQHSCACYAMKMINCPICDRTAELYAAGLKEAGYAISSKQSHGMWIIDRAHPELGPQYWTVSNTLMQQLWNLIQHPTDGTALPINHTVHGQDIFFTKKLSDKKIDGREIAMPEGLKLNPKATPLTEDPDLEDKWCKYVIAHTPIENFMTFLTPEQLANALQFDVEEGDDDDGFQEETKTTAASSEEREEAPTEPVPAGEKVSMEDLQSLLSKRKKEAEAE